MKLTVLAVAAALTTATFAALAHAPKIGVHGGPQVDAGSFHVEIVPRGTLLQVYLRDHSDKAVSTQGWKGIAILTIGGTAQRITLTPAGDNQLNGTASVDLPEDPKGAVRHHHAERQHRTSQVRLKRCQDDPDQDCRPDGIMRLALSVALT